MIMKVIKELNSLNAEIPERSIPLMVERRVLAKNAKLSRQKSPPMATDDQFDLFSRYLKNRHSHGGMSEMDAFEFSLMVEESNVHTAVYEYYDKEKLIAVCITDIIADGISMVYSFFDVESSKKNSLGNKIMKLVQ